MNRKGNRILYVSITAVAVCLAIFISYSVLGEGIARPILDFFIAERLSSGESVGPIEAIAVFLVVMTYMLLITILVVTASLTGWFVRKLRSVDQITLQSIFGVFQVKEPD